MRQAAMFHITRSEPLLCLDPWSQRLPGIEARDARAPGNVARSGTDASDTHFRAAFARPMSCMASISSSLAVRMPRCGGLSSDVVVAAGRNGSRATRVRCPLWTPEHDAVNLPGGLTPGGLCHPRHHARRADDTMNVSLGYHYAHRHPAGAALNYEAAFRDMRER